MQLLACKKCWYVHFLQWRGWTLVTFTFKPCKLCKMFAQQKMKKKCRSCCRDDMPRNCPAYGQSCKSCGLRNHFGISKLCPRNKYTYSQQSQWQEDKKIHELDAALQDGDEDERSDFEFDELFIWTLVVDYVEKHPKDSWTETVYVQDHNITFKLDTGAQCNVLPTKLCPFKEVSATSVKLVTYSKHKITPKGQKFIDCYHKGRKYIVYHSWRWCNANPVERFMWTDEANHKKC